MDIDVNSLYTKLNSEQTLYDPANGHFCPSTLSISEEYPDIYWKNRFKASRTEFSEILETADNSLALAYLTSCHEHDHFLRHSSSEYGGLLSLLLSFKYSAQLGLWQAAQKERGFAFQNEVDKPEFYNHYFIQLTSMLWSGNLPYNQKYAVTLINHFYQTHFSIDPVVKTSYPDEPYSPAAFLGYLNILEASAIFQEIASLDMSLSDNHDRYVELLRIDKRSNEIYWSIVNWLSHELSGIHSIAALCVRLSLDGSVPCIGSNYSEPIEWMDFHPGYRLNNYVILAKEFIEHCKLAELAPLFKKNPMHMYSVDIMQPCFDYLSYSAKNRGGMLLTHDKEKPKYEISFKKLLDSLNSEVADEHRTVLKGGPAPVLEHLFSSMKIIKTFQASNPLSFLLDHLVKYVDKDSEREPDESVLPRHKQDARALFSIFSNTYNSTYLEEKPDKVFGAIDYDLRLRSLELLFSGSSEKEIIQLISSVKMGQGAPDFINELIQSRARNNIQANLGIKL